MTNGRTDLFINHISTSIFYDNYAVGIGKISLLKVYKYPTHLRTFCALNQSNFTNYM